jgi:Protein of unknown function (DUF1499)
MFRLLTAFALAIFLTLTILPAATWAAASGLGVSNGHLASCPASQNCVVSQDADEKHAINPITYHLDRDKAQEILLKVLTVVPRTKVIEQTDNYKYWSRKPTSNRLKIQKIFSLLRPSGVGRTDTYGGKPSFSTVLMNA